MSPLRGSMTLLVCVCLALALAACGQRGPLYLPDEKQVEQDAQPQQSEEQDQEEDDEENS